VFNVNFSNISAISCYYGLEKSGIAGTAPEKEEGMLLLNKNDLFSNC
jgi:hypothetical protein